jgi:hypothetical protein
MLRCVRESEKWLWNAVLYAWRPGLLFALVLLIQPSEMLFDDELCRLMSKNVETLGDAFHKNDCHSL